MRDQAAGVLAWDKKDSCMPRILTDGVCLQDCSLVQHCALCTYCVLPAIASSPQSVSWGLELDEGMPSYFKLVDHSNEPPWQCSLAGQLRCPVQKMDGFGPEETIWKNLYIKLFLMQECCAFIIVKAILWRVQAQRNVNKFFFDFVFPLWSLKV